MSNNMRDTNTDFTQTNNLQVRMVIENPSHFNDFIESEYNQDSIIELSDDDIVQMSELSQMIGPIESNDLILNEMFEMTNINIMNEYNNIFDDIPDLILNDDIDDIPDSIEIIQPEYINRYRDQ